MDVLSLLRSLRTYVPSHCEYTYLVSNLENDFNAPPPVRTCADDATMSFCGHPLYNLAAVEEANKISLAETRAFDETLGFRRRQLSEDAPTSPARAPSEAHRPPPYAVGLKSRVCSLADPRYEEMARETQRLESQVGEGECRRSHV